MLRKRGRRKGLRPLRVESRFPDQEPAVGDRSWPGRSRVWDLNH